MERKQEFRVRTKKFASDIIRLYCDLSKTRTEVQVVGRQLLRAGTSVAANYREASRSRSAADFISKIETCAQEADETQLWLELLKESCGIGNKFLDQLWQEADELIAIFVTMSKNAKKGRGIS